MEKMVMPVLAGTKDNESELLTVKQVCQKLSISRQTVYKWIDRGWLVAVKFPSGGIRIPSRSVDDVIARGMRQIKGAPIFHGLSESEAKRLAAKVVQKALNKEL